MFKPLNGRVLIEPDPIAEQTSFGMVLLDPQKEKPVTGVVVIGGTDVATGDRVVFSKFGYDEVTIDKKLLYLVSEQTILGIFVDK